MRACRHSKPDGWRRPGDIADSRSPGGRRLRLGRGPCCTVEFGVTRAVMAGAVIAKRRADGHLKVTVSWQRDAISSPPPPDEISR
ncbi:CU044_2847 family protein [Streptomyces sp. NPDC060048]